MRPRTLLSLITTILVVGLVFASEASAWTQLGGDPLFPSITGRDMQAKRNDFSFKMQSSRADKAMQLMGLSLAERRAVRRAAATGRFYRCTLHYGDTFLKMSFGRGNILVDPNVTFADPHYRHGGAPAFCMDVEVPAGKNAGYELNFKVPWKCVNIALEKRTRTKSPPPPPPKVPATVRKDARGGSGTFTIQWRAGHEKWKTKRVKSGKRYTLTHVPRNTWVWLREKVPKGWELLSAPLMRKRATGRSLNFIVVNRKIKPPVPPAPKPAQPSCEQGTKFSDTQQVCVPNHQEQTAQQQCEAAGNRWNSKLNQCLVVQNNCGNVIIGDNNTVNGDNCTNNEENICTANGGSWYNHVCNLPPPPERKVCPPGQIGEYPNCEVPQCPPDQIGTPPNCRKPECPPGQIGEYPHCKPPSCPTGTIGTYPDCRRPECPSDRPGIYPDCRTPTLVAETPGLAHVYIGGRAGGDAPLFLKVKPSFPTSTITVLPRVTAGGGNVSGIQKWDTYANEPCPVDWRCYKATFWASNSTGPGRSTVTFFVSQDDGQRFEAPIDISIEADDFPV